MKKGEIVTIYEDPLTEKKMEGKARLVEEIVSDPPLESWYVRFIGEESDEYVRWIKTKGGK